MMTASAVLNVLTALDGARVRYWLDGGWGVDALLGRQTRRHSDVDLVLASKDAERVLAALRPLGLEVETDERPTRVELASPDQRSVDLHCIDFDRGGNGVQRLKDGGTFVYRAEGFNGRGRIGGKQVPCISAEVQMECHLGYEPAETDRADVAALAARFRLPISLPYLDGASGRRLQAIARETSNGHRAP